MDSRGAGQLLTEETEEDEEKNENICRQTIKQTDTNLITEAHSNPLWIVGERANISYNHVRYKSDHVDN